MNAVDLFCGCGGLSLGLMNAGIDVLAAWDKWHSAVETYRMNFDHPCHEEDLSDPQVQDRIAEMHPDLIAGGPPCQDFSIAGARDETRGRAVLTYSYRDIILKAKPKWFIMENVPRIAQSDIFADIKKSFRDAGYGLNERVMRAEYNGVPQKRRRMFLIGRQGAQDGFLNEILERNETAEPATPRNVWGEDVMGYEVYFIYPVMRTHKAVFTIDEPTITITGHSTRPIPSSYAGNKNNAVDARTPGLHVTQVRDCALFQTFPLDFKIYGGKQDATQQMGNAVPVKLAEAIGKAVMEYEALESKAKSIETFF